MPPALWIVIPMKPLTEAKMRLASRLMETERRGVALAMLAHVTSVASTAVGREQCIVVGGDELVEEAARESGARWEPERGHDLNSSLTLAMAQCWADGAQAVLVLPADVPMLAASDIDVLLDASDGLTQPAGVMAMSDGGTNAMLWPAGVHFAPSFGERSFGRHQSNAAAAGRPLALAPAPGLAFDVDTVDDLDYANANVTRFRESVAEWTHRAQVWMAEHPLRAPWEVGLGDE